MGWRLFRAPSRPECRSTPRLPWPLGNCGRNRPLCPHHHTGHLDRPWRVAAQGNMPSPAFLSMPLAHSLRCTLKAFSAFFLPPPNLGETLQTDPQDGHISKSQTECDETAGLSRSDSIALPSLLVATPGGEPRRPLPPGLSAMRTGRTGLVPAVGRTPQTQCQRQRIKAERDMASHRPADLEEHFI